MAETWDRPLGSGIPNKPGDSDPNTLFLALGKAVSAWEGVQVAVSSLYTSLVTVSHLESEEEARSAINSSQLVHIRAQRLLLAANDAAEYLFDVEQHEKKKFILRVEKLAQRYRGWAERRNDIAHGYVTEASHPDYSLEDQPIITTFSLCPSHARQTSPFSKDSRWHYGESDYNYRAEDLDRFTDAFARLDKDIEELATKLSRFSGHCITCRRRSTIGQHN
jgi:hypothetical protein